MRCASVGAGVEERGGDLLGRQLADLAQRQRDLRVGRERRVAAGEDEAQAIVLDRVLLGGLPRPTATSAALFVQRRRTGRRRMLSIALNRPAETSQARGCRERPRAATARARRGTLRAVPPRRGRSRRAGERASRTRGATPRDRPPRPSRSWKTSWHFPPAADRICTCFQPAERASYAGKPRCTPTSRPRTSGAPVLLRDKVGLKPRQETNGGVATSSPAAPRASCIRRRTPAPRGEPGVLAGPRRRARGARA